MKRMPKPPLPKCMRASWTELPSTIPLCCLAANSPRRPRLRNVEPTSIHEILRHRSAQAGREDLGLAGGLALDVRPLLPIQVPAASGPALTHTALALSLGADRDLPRTTAVGATVAGPPTPTDRGRDRPPTGGAAEGGKIATIATAAADPRVAAATAVMVARAAAARAAVVVAVESGVIDETWLGCATSTAPSEDMGRT